MNPVVFVVVYLAFFLHLLLAGAGLKRALSVIRASALAALATAALLAALPYFYFPDIGRAIFLFAAVVSSLFFLTRIALARAREFVVPYGSTFEIVCINVFMVSLGGPPKSLDLFEDFAQFAYFAILNPFAYLIPKELGWLSVLLCLWPSALALVLASRAPEGGRFGRLVLALWMQILGIVWVLPACVESVWGSSLDARYLFVTALFAAMGVVHVWLTTLVVRETLFGRLDTARFEEDRAQAVKTSSGGGLVDRMTVLALPVWAYVAGALCAYLLANATVHFFSDVQSITAGFFVIVGISSLVTRWYLGSVSAMPRPRPNAWIALAALLAGVFGLRAQPLLPSHERSGEPQIRERIPARIERMSPDEPAWCHVENKHRQPVVVQCGDQSWRLRMLTRRADPTVPEYVEDAGPLYSLKFLDRDARCQEFTMPAFYHGTQSHLVLIYLEGASRREEITWAYGHVFGCADLVVARLAGSPDPEPVILLPWSGEVIVKRPETLIDLGSLPTHPAESGFDSE
jgi:hypothetical protein